MQNSKKAQKVTAFQEAALSSSKDKRKSNSQGWGSISLPSTGFKRNLKRNILEVTICELFTQSISEIS